MSGYLTTRIWESDVYRLDTPETRPEIVTVMQKVAGFPILAGLGGLAQGFYHTLFNTNPKKAVEQGKARL